MPRFHLRLRSSLKNPEPLNRRSRKIEPNHKKQGAEHLRKRVGTEAVYGEKILCSTMMLICSRWYSMGFTSGISYRTHFSWQANHIFPAYSPGLYLLGSWLRKKVLETQQTVFAANPASGSSQQMLVCKSLSELLSTHINKEGASLLFF